MPEPQVDLVRGLTEAAGFGALGRLVYHALNGQRPSTVTLWLWEIPAAFGLGVMGQALGVWLELSDWPRAGLIAFIAAAGIKAIDAAIDRIFAGSGKK
jgi:hypothetical protein